MPAFIKTDAKKGIKFDALFCIRLNKLVKNSWKFFSTFQIQLRFLDFFGCKKPKKYQDSNCNCLKYLNNWKLMSFQNKIWKICKHIHKHSKYVFIKSKQEKKIKDMFWQVMIYAPIFSIFWKLPMFRLKYGIGELWDDGPNYLQSVFLM